ncbi:MAG TPA: hypothetical protein VHD55_02840 [Candidatus Paceibacterota bacterium]|nr:hypothetical protein [Candidatus Paceibacterota bacterium]
MNDHGKKGVLKQVIAEDLGGKTQKWWQGKLHVYMRQTELAREDLTTVKTELAAAVAKGESAKSQVAALEERVTRLETELAEAGRKESEFRAQIAELETEQWEPGDVEDIFNMMTGPWETAIASMEKEHGL